MAYENVPVTPGSGANIAVDTVGTDQIQVVKLDVGADGVASGPVSAANPMPVTAAALPLPAGAATEATLAGIKAGTDKIPASPAQEHATAASPHAARLSDGAAFYDAAKTGQLPAALVGGRLDVNVGAQAALPTGSNVIGKMSLVDSTGNNAMDDANDAVRVNLVVDSVHGITDNGGFSDGLTKLTPAGFVFDEVAGTALSENDAAAARVDSKRALVMGIEDATTRGQRAAVSAAGALKVDGSAVTQPVSGTVDTELPAAAALADAAANPTTPTAGAANLVFNGTTWDRARGDTANGIDVDVTRVGGTVTVGGVAAQGAAVSGNPMLNGAEARTTLPTAVTDGQAVRLQADKAGRLVVEPHSPRDLVAQGNITLTTTTETTLLAAVASTFLDLTLLVLSNTSATGVRVDIRDTTGGTVLLSVFLAASGGGAVIPFPVPSPQTTVNTNWTAQLSAAVTDVRIKGIAVKRN